MRPSFRSAPSDAIAPLRTSTVSGQAIMRVRSGIGTPASCAGVLSRRLEKEALDSWPRLSIADFPMKLIIQIPCFNEEAVLPATLAALPREVEGFDAVEWL